MRWLVLLAVVAVATALRHAGVSDDALVDTSFPDRAGVVTVLSPHFVYALAEDLGLEIADYANSYTKSPDVKGKSNGASYDFSKFQYDVNLDRDFFYTLKEPTSMTIGWHSFTFNILFNYHVVMDDWPNPAESGWVQVETTTNITIAIDATLDFDQPTISFSAQSTTLDYQKNDINIFVQCTDTVCLLPVDDIAKGVADNFVPSFQTSVNDMVNKAGGDFFKKFSTTLQLDKYHMALSLAGIMGEVPGSRGVVLPLYADFMVHSHPSPFVPTDIPADLLMNVESDVTVVASNYVAESLLWALWEAGDFGTKVITNENMPANTPLKLNTADFLLRLAVPGLSKLPEMNITIEITWAKYFTDVVFNGTAIDLKDGVFDMAFILTNATEKHMPGWTLSVTVTAVGEPSIYFTPQREVMLNMTTMHDFTFDVAVVSSDVGNVSTSSFEHLFSIISTAMENSFHPHAEVPFPSVVTPTGFRAALDDYLVVRVNGTLAKVDPKTISCPGDPAGVCPEGNTCCSDGCCPMPSATCCNHGGCCLHGWKCNGNQCSN